MSALPYTDPTDALLDKLLTALDGTISYDSGDGSVPIACYDGVVSTALLPYFRLGPVNATPFQGAWDMDVQIDVFTRDAGKKDASALMALLSVELLTADLDLSASSFSVTFSKPAQTLTLMEQDPEYGEVGRGVYRLQLRIVPV